MDERQSFDGFLPPVSNTTYTPNQFFDVVLRRGSRGAVRLVAYLIRKTLGWCDSEGCPRESQIWTPEAPLAHTQLVWLPGTQSWTVSPAGADSSPLQVTNAGTNRSRPSRAHAPRAPLLASSAGLTVPLLPIIDDLLGA